MNKTILQQLFNGEIVLGELTGIDPESRKLNLTIADEREHFLSILSETDRERLLKLNDLYHNSAVRYGDECYSYGFSLGVVLMIDVFNELHKLGAADEE